MSLEPLRLIELIELIELDVIQTLTCPTIRVFSGDFQRVEAPAKVPSAKDLCKTAPLRLTSPLLCYIILHSIYFH